MHLIIIGNVAVGLKVEVGKTQTRQVSFTWINWPDAKSYIAPPIKKPRSNKGKFPMYFKREWKHAEVWPLCLLCRMSSTGQGTFWLTVRVWSIWLNLPINSDIKTLSHDLKIPYHLLTEPLTPKNRGKKKKKKETISGADIALMHTGWVRVFVSHHTVPNICTPFHPHALKCLLSVLF